MVACQQSVSLGKGMCSDKKIRRHACPGTASLAIGLPGEACLESRFRLERAELDLQFSERVAAGRNRWKAASNLGPNHVAGEQRPLPSTGAQRIPGSGPELGIVIQEIKQHAGIDGGNHFSGYPPRSSFMISSVRRPSLRMPKYLSNGSRGARLVITKRPRSSLTSRTWPARMPSRRRRGFGMVTCPFSESVVFILLWYGFRLHLSNNRLTGEVQKAGFETGKLTEIAVSTLADPMAQPLVCPTTESSDLPMNR